jgi:solute:Na+ symporter, SSS family
MNYIQTLFSYFNAPLFAVFILALFWRRVSPWAGVWGQIAGIAAAFAFHYIGPHIAYFHAGQTLSGTQNDQMINFYGAIVAVLVAWVVMAVITPFGRAKRDDELRGLVYGLPDPNGPDVEAAEEPHAWWQSPSVLGYTALGITLVLSLVFL